jgi:hypothetical protein
MGDIAGRPYEGIYTDPWAGPVKYAFRRSDRLQKAFALIRVPCFYHSHEAVQYLVEILKTPIGEVTADHRLAQSYDAMSGKIELPNKLGAMQLLAKMYRRDGCRSGASR